MRRRRNGQETRRVRAKDLLVVDEPAGSDPLPRPDSESSIHDTPRRPDKAELSQAVLSRIGEDVVSRSGARPLRDEELEEVVEVVLAQVIRGNEEGRNLLEWVEEWLIRVAWAHAGSNTTRAARQLGIDRKRVERRVRKYQIVSARKAGMRGNELSR